VEAGVHVLSQNELNENLFHIPTGLHEGQKREMNHGSEGVWEGCVVGVG